MTKVLLAWQGASSMLSSIASRLPVGCKLVTVTASPQRGPYEADPDEVTSLARDAEIIIGWHIPREAVAGASVLRLISAPHAGVDLFDFKLLRDKGITLCNARGVNAIPVAEHAVALMLALAKRITTHDAAVKRTDWVEWSADTASVQMAGKTVAIVGIGHIGREVGKRCKAFDMTVIGVRRRPDQAALHADRTVTIEQLPDVLPLADFVVVVLPLTRVTNGLIGDAEIRQMKTTAFLLNLGRGMVVQERPLYDALVSRRLAGFAADVWWDYSLSMPVGYHYNVPSRSAVHRLPNVIGTANVAANVAGIRDRMLDATLENVRQFINGDPLTRQVDLTEEY